MTKNETESLEELYNSSIPNIKEGQVIKGKIVKFDQKEALVDIGYKSEGVVPAFEFGPGELEIGKEVNVFVESIEDDDGKMILSKEKAEKLQGWQSISEGHKEGDLLDGKVIKKVKGGFIVSVFGVEGFLPASLSMFKGVPEKEVLGNAFRFVLVKVDTFRKTLVVSRREAVKTEKEEAKKKLWEGLQADQVRSGTVKAITDFGAFIDLGGVDGLLHIADMSWSRVSHPSEVVAIGDKIEVMILGVDKDNNRVSLGLKQLTPDPWKDIESRYTVSSKVKGKVVNIVPYGVFLELERGIEGLIHISDMSWTKKINNPNEMFAIGDTAEVVVLNIDKDNKRISLGVKQLESDPWKNLQDKYPQGAKVEGKVRNLTDYGAFVELQQGIEGLIHISDMSWTKRINHPQEILKKGQRIETVILSMDAANRRISLGLKQLTDDPWSQIAQEFPAGSSIKGKVSKVVNFGCFIEIKDGLEGLLHVSELNLKQDQRPEDTLKPGDEIDVVVNKVDVEQHKISLVKKSETKEEPNEEPTKEEPTKEEPNN